MLEWKWNVTRVYFISKYYGIIDNILLLITLIFMIYFF